MDQSPRMDMSAKGARPRPRRESAGSLRPEQTTADRRTKTTRRAVGFQPIRRRSAAPPPLRGGCARKRPIGIKARSARAVAISEGPGHDEERIYTNDRTEVGAELTATRESPDVMIERPMPPQRARVDPGREPGCAPPPSRSVSHPMRNRIPQGDP